MNNNIKIEQGVILAGGIGSRLKKITQGLPKSLIKINNKPFIEHLLQNFSRQGFKKILILCSYKSKLFFKKYHKRKYLNLYIYCIKEEKPLGTGGALLNANKFLDKYFFLCNGDTLFNINLNDLIKSYKKKMILLMSLTNDKNKNRFTTVAIKKNGLVEKINQDYKKKKYYINTGYYVCSKDILKYIDKKCSLEKEVFFKLIKNKKLYYKIYKNKKNSFLDIGVPKDFFKAKKFINRNLYKPTIFLDRDGVINKDSGYVYKIKDFIWKKNIIKLIKYFNDNNYYVIVLSNQSGIGRGFYKEKNVKELHNWINLELRKKGAFIDKFYYAPYYSNSKYAIYRKNKILRKPNVGMLDLALKEFNINLNKSIMLGDKNIDYILAKKKKIKFFFVDFNKKIKIFGKYF